ncbi:hypothetical protein [Streptomyces sp. NPDC029526]|uniref:hypothetical protein n=1 Tax=Streptomyces sp. NPDC029526 TaxID=3155728 RepID=UPI0033CA9C53
MTQVTALLLEPLLRLLLPGRGRRRRTAVPGGGRRITVPVPGAVTARPPGPPPLRGEDNALVRPYLIVHEREEEARRQRARRRVPSYTVHGVGSDNVPRVLHGAGVTA